jgi:alanine racemase
MTLKQPIPNTFLTIYPTKIRENIRRIKASIPSSCHIMAVVKANAYGLGADRIATLCEDEGVSYLAVACIQEAIALRKAGISLPILLFGETHLSNIPYIIANDIHATVFTDNYITALGEYAEHEQIHCHIHIKVDTGMNRVGFKGEHLSHIIRHCYQFPHLKIAGLYSHFAFSEHADCSKNDDQLNRFQAILSSLSSEGIDIGLAHLANTNGLKRNPKSHLDMVRIGLGLYDNAYSFTSVVSHVKSLRKGDTVSYEGTYTCERDTIIATVAAGYADGVPRGLGNSGHVLIKGKRFPIVGTVCMDNFMVDLGDNSTHISRHDSVTIIGNDGTERITVSEICTASNSNPRELSIRLAQSSRSTFIFA